MRFPFIINEETVTVYLKGKALAVTSENRNFKRVCVGLVEDTFTNPEEIEVLIDTGAYLESFSQGDMRIEKGVLYYKSLTLSNGLVRRILEMIAQNRNITPFVLFVEKLYKNPRQEVILELFEFLDKNRLPITKDGNFLAYKRVRDNFLDIHSESFDNSPGEVLEMDRGEVDPERDRTCSTGFHFCSYDYLSQFASASCNRTVVVEVDPADVVAFPQDYNTAKGRTCKYVVLSEITNPEGRIKEDYVDETDACLEDFSEEEDEYDFYDDYDSYWDDEPEEDASWDGCIFF